MIGRIYFIACEPLSAVKIGFTSGDAQKRLKELQTGCPVKLQLLGCVIGTQDEERMVHKRFARRRMQGEWFKIEENGRSSLERLLIEINPKWDEPNGSVS